MMHVTNPCKQTMASNNETQFSILFNGAWGKTMVPQVITAGFKRAGVYPFNPVGICDDSANMLSSDTSTIFPV